jgi:hypothetical protein
MGAWGIGIFENDTACDFAAAVANGGGVPLVEQALDRVSCAAGTILKHLTQRRVLQQPRLLRD